MMCFGSNAQLWAYSADFGFLVSVFPETDDGNGPLLELLKLLSSGRESLIVLEVLVLATITGIYSLSLLIILSYPRTPNLS